MWHFCLLAILCVLLFHKCLFISFVLGIILCLYLIMMSLFVFYRLFKIILCFTCVFVVLHLHIRHSFLPPVFLHCSCTRATELNINEHRLVISVWGLVVLEKGAVCSPMFHGLFLQKSSFTTLSIKWDPCCSAARLSWTPLGFSLTCLVDVSRSCTVQEVSVVEHAARPEARRGQGCLLSGGQRSGEQPAPQT